MAKDYLYIGNVPTDEDCAQLGCDEDFSRKNRIECIAYKHQLERKFENLPKGMYFGVKSENHDCGTYREIVIYFDDENEDHLEILGEIESGAENWDMLALKELEENEYYIGAKIIQLNRKTA
jgi:hypothetical protein